LLRQEYLDRTRKFYARHGGKTIILAQFVPIIRTFAPFVAGVGAMSYARFITYNLVGAGLWVGLFVLGGYFFGTIPTVRENFTLVILAIVAISLAPIMVELVRSRRSRPA
jgi:membrane-associated protein